MRTQILLNQNTRESFIRGYKDGDPLMRVFDGDKSMAPTTIEHVLDDIFMANQWVSEHHKPWYENRSLSMGDIIVLGERAYSIDRVGFTVLEEVPFA